MKDIINKVLFSELRDENLKILFAVEAGSRAWGFESENSDYDIRFVYIRPPSFYLSLKKQRDTIEFVSGNYDISGWDVKKAIYLFSRSNPQFIEWLHSPIVYTDRDLIRRRFKERLPEVYRPQAAHYHYLNMAKGAIKAHMGRGKIELKKYFYILRPLLAIKWINKDLGPVPVEFERLLPAIEEGEIKGAVTNLLAEKRTSPESEKIHPIPVLDKFIKTEVRKPSPLIFPRLSPPNLDGFFLELLTEHYGLKL